MPSEEEVGADKTLEVWLHDEMVGNLYQIATGELNFQYVAGASRRLSLSLPVQPNVFTQDQCFAYFDGLLPESRSQREAIARKFSINSKNSFRLLQEIGADCAGAVSFHSPRTRKKEERPEELKEINEDELEKLILDLPNDPLFINKDNEIRLSLAGAQSKGAVVYRGGKLYLPVSDTPTTHIVKPAVSDIYETPPNEYFCLRLAKQLGIEAPTTELRLAGKTPYLLVERYDRYEHDGTIKRVHQEDFCQALNVVSVNKYESDGGPSVLRCMDLLFETSSPVVSRTRFMQMLVFNYLVGNMDAHGKNYSLLHKDNGEIGLAPLYDVASTLVYADLSRKMAMKIADKYDPVKVFPRHWKRECERIGYSYPALLRMLKVYAETLPGLADSELSRYESEGHKSKVLSNVHRLITDNCKLALERIANSPS